MGRKTTQGRMGCAAAVAVATLFITVLAAAAGPLTAQVVIELPAEDRPLDAGFEEIYRLGSLDGGGWDSFGIIAGVGFDGGRRPDAAGNDRIPPWPDRGNGVFPRDPGGPQPGHELGGHHLGPPPR